MLLLSASASSQSSAPPDELLKECEACADERKVLRVENAGLKEQLRLKDEMIALQAKSLAERGEIIAFWKAAATERKTALTVDDRIYTLQESQLTECRAEVARLRNPSFFQRLFKPDTITAGVIGFGLGTIKK